MASRNKSNDESDRELKSWQSEAWCSLTSPCILGLAYTEAVMVGLIHGGFSRSSYHHPSLIQRSVPADEDSYARAMDLVIGETEPTLIAFVLQDGLSGAGCKNARSRISCANGHDFQTAG
jgi:hypothetical protein